MFLFLFFFHFLFAQTWLQREFGQKTGETLWNYAHGVDDTQLKLFQVWQREKKKKKKEVYKERKNYVYVDERKVFILTVVTEFFLSQQRKSIGCDVNWGIRFTEMAQVRIE